MKKSPKEIKTHQGLIKILFNIMDIEEIVEGKEIKGIEERIEEIKGIIIEIMDEE
jgi:hypothetical protein